MYSGLKEEALVMQGRRADSRTMEVFSFAVLNTLVLAEWWEHKVPRLRGLVARWSACRLANPRPKELIVSKASVSHANAHTHKSLTVEARENTRTGCSTVTTQRLISLNYNI